MNSTSPTLVGPLYVGDVEFTDSAGLAALGAANGLLAAGISPARVQHHPFVREVIAELLSRSRQDAMGRELRGMAYRAPRSLAPPTFCLCRGPRVRILCNERQPRVISMSDDPFMPSARRFPRDAWPPVGSDELPSGMRPFILRGAQQVPSAVTAKHRTAPYQTPHTSPTTRDGASVPDTWYEPDD